MGGASVAVWVTAAPEGNAATFCFPGTRACAAMVWRWLSRRREMWGRSGDVADDDTGRRVFAGASTEFGTTSTPAGGVSEVSTGGERPTTFGEPGACRHSRQQERDQQRSAVRSAKQVYRAPPSDFRAGDAKAE